MKSWLQPAAFKLPMAMIAYSVKCKSNITQDNELLWLITSKSMIVTIMTAHTRQSKVLVIRVGQLVTAGPL